MREEKSKRKFFSSLFLRFPADLVAAAVWLVLAVIAIYLPLPEITPVRVLFALPLMLFIPGYCVIAALFPKEGDIDLIERFVLSAGSSMVIVPLIGLGLNFTPWGIHLEPLVISISLFTFLLILAAHHARSHIPYDERFRVSFTPVLRQASASQKKSDRVFTLVLALLILIAIFTAAYVISVPREGERFTELFVLGSNMTAADYPDRVIAGQNYPVYVGVRNHEYRNALYTIEIWMMRMEFDNVTSSSRIAAMDPAGRVMFPLVHDQYTIIPYNVSVNSTVYNRVEFLLFDENIPGFEITGSNRINASYRNIHLLFRIEDAPEIVEVPDQQIRNPPRSTR